MQQFVVPQFLDVEDKVIGPITVRQFIILLIAAGVEFLAWKFADISLFFVETIANAFCTILLAFVKVNGRPVHYFFLNFIQTTKRPWLRIWYKEFHPEELKHLNASAPKENLPRRAKPMIGTSRLAELSLIVDTGGIYEGEGK